MKSIALVLTESPFADTKGHDALDMSMVLGSFEIPTALFFLGAGVNQLRQLHPEVFAIKNYTKSFAALPFYDVEDLYACKEDLQQWNMSETALMDDLQILSNEEIQARLAQFNRVIRF